MVRKNYSKKLIEMHPRKIDDAKRITEEAVAEYEKEILNVINPAIGDNMIFMLTAMKLLIKDIEESYPLESKIASKLSLLVKHKKIDIRKAE